VTGACFASRTDVLRLQAEVAAARVEALRADTARAAQVDALAATLRRIDDSVGVMAARNARFQGDAREQLRSVREQLIQVQELTGQSQRRLQDLRASLEASGAQAAPAAPPARTPDAGPASGAAPGAAPNATTAGAPDAGAAARDSAAPSAGARPRAPRPRRARTSCTAWPPSSTAGAATRARAPASRSCCAGTRRPTWPPTRSTTSPRRTPASGRPARRTPRTRPS
jgi:hypothetical protein